MRGPHCILRNATVLSLQQLEDDASPCSSASVAACARGAALPFFGYATTKGPVEGGLASLLSFTSGPSFTSSASSSAAPAISRLISNVSDASDASDDSASDTSLCSREGSFVVQGSDLDSAMLELWDDAFEKGLFRYDVGNCSTRVIDGRLGFIAQLNVGRANQKRPTEFRVDLVCQPFDDSKFNFTKAYMREVLLQFEPSVAPGGAAQVLQRRNASANPNVVLINVSPIEYGHVLLVPRVLEKLPQLITPDTLLLALRFADASGNPFMRVGYNSLGAYATINHLHFQAYYLATPFPCERAGTQVMGGLEEAEQDGVVVSRMTDYPVNGFVVEASPSCAACPLEALAACVGRAAQRMQAANVPFNLLLAQGGQRVYVWPQRYAEAQAQGEVPEDLLDTGVNPATFEIAGHLVLKRQQDYDAMDEALAWRMLEQVSLGEEAFASVARMCFGRSDSSN